MPKRHLSRRSISGKRKGETLEPHWGDNGIILSDSESIDFLSTLRMPTTRRRNRRWEQKFKAKTYRGVSPQAHAAVKEAAANQGCSIDQAAVAFLEYALTCYQRGDRDLCLEPEFRCGRWTLYPEWFSHSKLPKNKVVWSENKWDLKPPKSREGIEKSDLDPAPIKPWKDWPWVSYRLPDTVVEAIDKLRIDRTVPAGEVVTRLLEHASRAYCTGRLVLTLKIFDAEDR